MSTVKVTDDSFDADVLKSASPCWSISGPSGAAPASRSPPRSTRSPRSCRAGHHRQGQHRGQPDHPSRYGVRGIPTMMLFKDGQMASMKVGAMPKQKILEWLAETGVIARAA